jgi:hypothetical protein
VVAAERKTKAALAEVACGQKDKTGKQADPISRIQFSCKQGPSTYGLRFAREQCRPEGALSGGPNASKTPLAGEPQRGLAVVTGQGAPVQTARRRT